MIYDLNNTIHMLLTYMLIYLKNKQLIIKLTIIKSTKNLKNQNKSYQKIYFNKYNFPFLYLFLLIPKSQTKNKIEEEIETKAEPPKKYYS